MSPPKLSEVCLVANLQTMGPTFLASAKEAIFDHGAGMLLAARIVITSGMGNSTTGLDKLNGPIPISELNLDKNYACYFYPRQMQQQPKPDNEFSTGKGTFIICLIMPEDEKDNFRAFERLMERTIVPHLDNFDFSQSISGEVPSALREEFSKYLNQIYEDLNSLLRYASQYEGGSLFDIGLLASLPDELEFTAKKLIMNPKGTLETEIADKSALKSLYQAGLVEREDRDGKIWIIPR